MIDLCDRFHALPSAVLAEDSRIVGMVLMADGRGAGASTAEPEVDDMDLEWG